MDIYPCVSEHCRGSAFNNLSDYSPLLSSDLPQCLGTFPGDDEKLHEWDYVHPG